MRCHAFHQAAGRCDRHLVQVRHDPPDHRRIWKAGDHLDPATAVLAGTPFPPPPGHISSGSGPIPQLPIRRMEANVTAWSRAQLSANGRGQSIDRPHGSETRGDAGFLLSGPRDAPHISLAGCLVRLYRYTIQSAVIRSFRHDGLERFFRTGSKAGML
jgi:hypothetical protein